MHRIKHLLVLVGAALLGACGAQEAADRSSATAAAAPGTAPATGNATAEEVARESRGKIKCPAKLASAARAEHAPVDDVLGVRPGIAYDEAVSIVLCTHDLLVVQDDTSRRYNIETYGNTIRQGFAARFAEPRVEKTSQQIMREMQDEFSARSGNAVRSDVNPGQAKWYVGTIGVPGQEQVISVAREEWFEAGRNPPLASVEQALIEKYGPPSRNQRNGHRYMSWIFDPLGRRATETSQLFHRCTGSSDPDGATTFLPDCGVVVTATIIPLRDNPDLSQYFQVGIVDQARGYDQITTTEQALQQLDAKRRAAEVDDAAKNAAPPSL